MNFIKRLKLMKAPQYLTIIFFTISFVLSILDPFYTNIGVNLLSDINTYRFWIGYFIMSYILIKTSLFFMKFAVSIQLSSKITIKENMYKTLKIVFLGYYFGMLIGFSNAFIIVAFDRFIGI